MLLTFEPDSNCIKMNQHVRYPGNRSIRSQVTVGYTDRHTHRTDCTTWTTKVIGNKFSKLVKGEADARPPQYTTVYSQSIVIRSIESATVLGVAYPRGQDYITVPTATAASIHTERVVHFRTAHCRQLAC